VRIVLSVCPAEFCFPTRKVFGKKILSHQNPKDGRKKQVARRDGKQAIVPPLLENDGKIEKCNFPSTHTRSGTFFPTRK